MPKYPRTPHMMFALVKQSRDNVLIKLEPGDKPTEEDREMLQSYSGKPVKSLDTLIEEWEKKSAEYEKVLNDPNFEKKEIVKITFAGSEEEQEKTRIEAENSKDYEFIRWVE